MTVFEEHILSRKHYSTRAIGRDEYIKRPISTPYISRSPTSFLAKQGQKTRHIIPTQFSQLSKMKFKSLPSLSPRNTPRSPIHRIRTTLPHRINPRITILVTPRLPALQTLSQLLPLNRNSSAGNRAITIQIQCINQIAQ